MWHCKRLLRVPCTGRRWNHSILKEINSEYSLKGLMLKLKLQYFCHLMRRTNSLEKTLMLGKIKGRRKSVCQRMRLFYGLTDLDMNLNNLQKWWCIAKQGMLQFMGLQSQTRLSDWTELLYWLCQSLWLCGSQQTMENSSRDENTRPPLPAFW